MKKTKFDKYYEIIDKKIKNQEIDLQRIYRYEFYCDDLHKQISVKEWLISLLRQLFIEKDGFSGKRPFGNSCWEYQLESCLVSLNVIEGKITFDEEYVVDDWYSYAEYKLNNEIVLVKDSNEYEAAIMCLVNNL